MNYKYIVRRDKISTKNDIVYGIDVQHNGIIVKSVLGLFSSEQDAYNFAECCNRLDLDIIHLDDVVLDLLKERELSVVM